MIYFTADWHFGDDRLELMGRPFRNMDHYIDTIITNINEKVKPDDTLIVVGDVVFQGCPNPHSFLKELKYINGRKILIRGNHDRIFSDDDLLPHFEKVIDEGLGVEWMFDKIPFYITHYPTLGNKYRFNLVGHIHGAWKVQLNMLNVGVDVHHFRPVSQEQVLFAYNAISNFYDADVWVAYHETNDYWLNKRGKKGSYFKG